MRTLIMICSGRIERYLPITVLVSFAQRATIVHDPGAETCTLRPQIPLHA